ncbi:PfkB family carbohydrate kinase [Herbiconiux sp. CPCC 205716]|uniref:PfkB family carbohydrate kinase n=1 Tax=Herbiconiux gentiana TaxID=2970912 RepID=A0ABT2GBG6_9MICO|nr:PfkB family carbohydrate kinase [Herbiconiux gentiana]MCS5713549.1 PfkB family carbohydrate kinase [Herbiconiux gentiana]
MPVIDAPSPDSPSATAPRFAVVGDNTIDRYLDGDGGVLVGGNALNVAVQLALHGDAVRYFGAVADDRDGRIIRAALDSAGIGDADVSTLPGFSAVTEIRTLANGDRVFEREEFGVTADYYPSNAEIESIAQADRVHIGMLPRAGELRAALRASNPHCVISQDLGVSAGTDSLDIAFSSGAMLEGTSPEEELEQQLAAGVRFAVVTLGEDGSIGSSQAGWVVHCAAAPTTVVDTTGAGDSFIAGFLHAHAQGAELESCLASGADWAAVTCGHVGGWPQD